MRLSAQRAVERCAAFALPSATIFLPETAHADALIPYMWVPFGQVFLFPLVVLAEAAVIWKMLAGTKLLAMGHSLVMNLASTLVGAALYVATSNLVGEPLYNFWWQSGLKWQGMVAAFISLVFALVLFGTSWLIEAAILKRLRPTVEPRRVVSACGYANALTYAALLGLAVWAA